MNDSRWRPLRIRPDGTVSYPTPDAGHVLVGALRTSDGMDALTGWSPLHMPTRRALPVLLAEVLAVGAGCRVNVGDRVLIQRFSGQGGMDPFMLREYVAEGSLDRFAGFQVVRCDLAIKAQHDGIDTALVTTQTLIRGLRHLVRTDKAFSPDDPRGMAATNDLNRFEALKSVLLQKRRGRAHNMALAACGLQTGDDGAAFDGVLAVVEG